MDPDLARHFDADPDPEPIFHCDADPDPSFHFDADPDPEHTFHFDADPNPDPDPSFQVKAQTLKKCSNRLVGIPYILACHLQCCGCLSRIPDPKTVIPDPKTVIPDPGSKNSNKREG